MGCCKYLPSPKIGTDRRNAHKLDQSPHVAVPWTAVDHRRAQDGVFQSARFDGKFRRHTDFFTRRIQLREDGGRADEDRTLDARIFCGADDRVRVTEAERGNVDEGVSALHGGGQGLRVGYITQRPFDLRLRQPRAVAGCAIETADFESVFEEEWDDARACESCCACDEDFHCFLFAAETQRAQNFKKVFSEFSASLRFNSFSPMFRVNPMFHSTYHAYRDV